MRGSVVVAVGSTVAIAIVLISADRVLTSDNDALMNDLAEDRLHALEQVAIEVETDLEQVADDLTLSQAMIRSASSAVDRERELRAIVKHSREHRLARVYNKKGRVTLEVVSDRQPLSRPYADRIRAEMDRVAAQAASLEDGRALTSDAVSLSDQDRTRIVAIGWTHGTVALAIDTGAILRPLRAVAADRSTMVFLLRPDGTLESFADGAGVDAEALEPIRTAFRDQEAGVVHLTAETAQRIGLDHADGVAAFVHFGGPNAQYIAATVTTSSIIKEQQRMIVTRVSTAAGVILLMIGTLGGWTFVSGRREIALREQLRLAERIAHEREKAEKILASVPTLVVALSAEERVTSVNRAFEDRVGPCQVGGDLESAFPGATGTSLEHLRALLREARTASEPRTEFAPNLTLFGEDGQFSLCAAPLEHPLGDTEILLVIEDLTRLGALEAQLLRAEKLATVGVLSAGVAHEIGTPLGIARGRAEYVISKLGPDDQNRAHLQLVLEQIDRVTRIIRQLLDFTRARKIQTKRVELGRVAGDVAELLRFELERRSLRLELAIDPDVAPLRAEPEQLEQVLLNLLLNASQASRAGSRIVVRARTDQKDRALQLFSVEDEGVGIPAHLITRVFDPFFTTKKRGQGTGLGLTIVQQIVTNHGGRLDLESEEGSGTRVLVKWPTSQ